MSVRDIDYHSVRYTQEYFYPRFSNAKMSVSETYIALANGFLDPAALAPITIFEHDNHLYCIDTRRLTIAKELQRHNKLDVLKRFNIQYVEQGDKAFAGQYLDLVNNRLPAMRTKGLDGSTVKIDHISGYMCCFNAISGKFRDDLEAHIARDHLKLSLLDFQTLNICPCLRCDRNILINAIKPSSKSDYRFVQNCSCRSSESSMLHAMHKPWTDVTFREFCNEFLELKQSRLTVSASLKSAMKSSASKRHLYEFNVPLARQSHYYETPLYINRNTRDVEEDSSIKNFCQLLLRLLIIVILFWLMFAFFSTK